MPKAKITQDLRWATLYLDDNREKWTAKISKGVASSEELSTHPYCIVRLKTGLLCRGGRQADSLFCYFHDPELIDARKEARMRGSKLSKDKILNIKMVAPKLETPDDVRQLAVETIHQIRIGDLGAKEGSVISSILSHVLKTLPETSYEDDTANKLRVALMEDDESDK
jgi:hypothetical protein